MLNNTRHCHCIDMEILSINMEIGAFAGSCSPSSHIWASYYRKERIGKAHKRRHNPFGRSSVSILKVNHVCGKLDALLR